ncbi:MAG: cation:proton antiporter [Candidatus Aenigmarchaeota archaeon]|nr:cation:proton antiporter [Candidatus Aenigmarchaeota archaeon]
MVALDPIVPVIAIFTLVVLVLGVILRYLGQPYVIAYIVAGLLLGANGLGLSNDFILSQLGTVGIILLLFFIGMEVSLPRLVSNWRVAIVGTTLQIILSVILIVILGTLLSWPLERSILFGFVISLSSTAVVLKILEDRNELNTKVGQNMLGVLLVQDLAVIPMLIILSMFGGKSLSGGELALPLIGTILIIGTVSWIVKRGGISLPFGEAIRQDHETQVFVALVIAFGFALVTALFGLSSAFGAFVAGILVAATRETHWIHMNLNPFRIVFVALFFVYIGMLISIDFLLENLLMIGVLTVAVFVVNTVANAVIFRFLGDGWKESFYSGALLSQIGEFSFVLVSVGLHQGLVAEFGYNITISIIALTLLLSPFWIYFMKRVTQADFKKYTIPVITLPDFPGRGKSKYSYKPKK